MADNAGGSNQTEPALASDPDRFQWHPTYKGRSFETVRRELAHELARDQRAYNLAMDGAEANEHDSLSSVIDLDRKWSDFDLGWTEADPDALAGRIIVFEAERDRRHELMPWREYLDERNAVPDPVKSASALGAPWLWMIVAIIVVAIVIIIIIATVR